MRQRASRRILAGTATVLTLLAGLLLLPAPLPAESGLPLPRFVSLRADEVNVRTGPGVRYPVDWVFRRAGLPVEVVAEFDAWRRIRDWQGAEGWVHQSLLSGRRTVLVTGEIRNLHRRPAAESGVVAMAEPGVVGRLGRCEGEWCQVRLGGFAGWLRRGAFWGIYPGETPD